MDNYRLALIAYLYLRMRISGETGGEVEGMGEMIDAFGGEVSGSRNVIDLDGYVGLAGVVYELELWSYGSLCRHLLSAMHACMQSSNAASRTSDSDNRAARP